MSASTHETKQQSRQARIDNWRPRIIEQADEDSRKNGIGFFRSLQQHPELLEAFEDGSCTP